MAARLGHDASQPRHRPASSRVRLHTPQCGWQRRDWEFRRFGVVIARWEEHPFDFAHPERLSIVRDYLKGPLIQASIGIKLVPDGQGTHVRVWGEFTPRNLIGRLLTGYVGPRLTHRALAQCRLFED